MAKKRKAGFGSAGSGSKGTNIGPSKYNLEERFDDSEDEFQTGRDEILLDGGPEAKRKRNLGPQGLFFSLVE